MRTPEEITGRGGYIAERWCTKKQHIHLWTLKNLSITSAVTMNVTLRWVRVNTRSGRSSRQKRRRIARWAWLQRTGAHAGDNVGMRKHSAVYYRVDALYRDTTRLSPPHV